MPILADISWPVRTERLTLRLATADDSDATFRYRRLAVVSEWMTTHTTDREVYREKFLEPQRLAKTLLIELDGVVIGDLMVAIGDAWAQSELAEHARAVEAELGWCLDPAYLGHGYATEAVRGIIQLCFGDLGLRRLTAECFADNDPSWRLMERVGMRREGHFRQDSLHRSGQWLDGFGYALLASEVGH